MEGEVSSAVMILVQNKVDLMDCSAMTHDEVNAVAKRLHLKLFRTSVKEKFNVEEVFTHLSIRFLERQARGREEESRRTAVQSP